MQRRLIYVDPMSGGHHASHLAFYSDRCAELGVELLAVVPHVVWDQAQTERMCKNGEARLLREEPKLPVGLRAKLGLLRKVRAAADGAVGETAWFFPVLDDFLICMIPACLSGVVGRWSGVLFRDEFNYPGDELMVPDQLAKSMVRYAVLAATQFTDTPGLGTLNPFWKAWLPKSPTWIPDALSSADETAPPSAPMTEPARAPGRLRLLMFGAMAPRKGVRPMMEAILKVDAAVLANLDLRIVGAFQDDALRTDVDTLRASLEAAGGVVGIEDRYVSPAELEAAILWCDLVLAPYQQHRGSSGVLGLAARFGRPVLGQSTYQIGEEIRRYGLGEAVDTGSVDALTQGLQRLAAADPFSFRAGQHRLRVARNRATTAAAIDGLLGRLYRQDPAPGLHKSKESA